MSGLERLAAHRWSIGAAALTVALALVAAAMGMPAEERAGMLPRLEFVWLSSGGIALAYLLAGVGLGGPIARRLVPAGPERAWVQAALGTGVMLWVSHALGVAGLLSGSAGQIVALAAVSAGLGMLAMQVFGALQAGARGPRPLPAWALLAAPGLALMLVAAACPPGWLWSSEAYGYDVLSYHLELPREWVRTVANGGAGRVWPVEHNTFYSYLPNYVESAFTHIAAMLGAGVTGPSGRASGLLGDDGMGALACQFLQVGFAVLAAGVTARLVATLLARWGVGTGPRRMGAGLAAAVVLCTPWMVVVSSMAYDEAAMLALMAGAMLTAVAAPREEMTWRQGLAAGALLGLAWGAKPTAAFFAGPIVALMLAANAPARRWAWVFGACVIGGAAAVGPPLARNVVACGNPIFPAGAGVFGSGPWNGEQLARYKMAHSHEGTVLDGLGLLVETHGKAGAAATSPDAEPRGVFHSQWFFVFPLAVAAAGVAGVCVRRREARVMIGAMAGGAVVSVAWWAGFSHAQSRFLLPLLVPMAAAIGAAAAIVGDRARASDGTGRARAGVGIVLSLLIAEGLAVKSAVLLFAQRHDKPGDPVVATAGIVLGTDGLTGELDREEMAPKSRAEQEKMEAELGPVARVNLGVPANEGVYLLGSSTPFYFTGRVVYHTTWSTSPLGAAMRAHPNDPEAWTQTIEKLGVRYVLVDFGEIHRLRQDGWYDPDVTEEAVMRWLGQSGRRVRMWPNEGQGLFELREVKGGAGAGDEGDAGEAGPPRSGRGAT